MKSTWKSVLLIVITLIGTMLSGGCRKNNDTPVGPINIKIGVILDFSGERALESEQMFNAIEMAVKEINEAGGVLAEHYKLELIKKDDGGQELQSAACYYQLAEEGACVIIGTNNTAGMKQIMDISGRENIAVITPSVSDNFLVKSADFGFQSCISNKYMTKAMIAFVKKNGEKRISVIFDPVQPQQVVWYEDFIVSALDEKMETAYADECDFTDMDKIEEAFKNIEKSGSKYTFVPADTKVLETVIIPAARKAGYTGSFLCSLSQKDIEDTQGYDVFMPCNMAADSTVPDIKIFLEKYLKEYSQHTSSIQICDGVRPAYDAVYMIRDAIEKGCLATTASIALKLPFLEGNTVTGYYEIGAYGDSSKAVDIILINNSMRTYVTSVFE